MRVDRRGRHKDQPLLGQRRGLPRENEAFLEGMSVILLLLLLLLLLVLDFIEVKECRQQLAV